MRWFVLMAGLFTPFAVSAAELETHSKIEAVTLFPNSALVSRVAEVDLPAGETTVLFDNLPSGLDPASVQVSAQASGNVVLGLVSGRVIGEEPKPNNAAEVRLKELHSLRDGWQAKLEALEAEKEMMLRFSRIGPEKLGPDSKPLEVTDWTKAWSAIGSGLVKLSEDMRTARMEVHDLDWAISVTEAPPARASSKTGLAREVAVETEAAGPSKVRFTVTYRVGGANWIPRYEVRLQTPAALHPGTLEFTRHAAISQSTGEDWTDIDLTVSTFRVERGAAPPDLQPQKVGFREIPPVNPMALARKAGAMVGTVSRESGTAPQLLAAAEAAKPASPAPLQDASERPAAIDAGAFTASFKIAGRVSLVSDGTVKIAPISTRSVMPELWITTIPVLDQTAYLVSRFTNDKETPLLPGEVMLYRDGSYIGSSKIAFVAGGDVVDLSFGADDRVEVVRVPVKRKEDESSWFGQTKSDTREFKTSIENLHDIPIKITLIDAVPFSEDTAITVEQLAMTTPPTQTTVADKRGVTSWTYEYGPHETKEIRLAYRMKWPADREVMIEPAPLSAGISP
jgi:uncharacterized protein (TIGR02231 family)